jgi:hypothetical protein
LAAGGAGLQVNGDGSGGTFGQFAQSEGRQLLRCRVNRDWQHGETLSTWASEEPLLSSPSRRVLSLRLPQEVRNRGKSFRKNPHSVINPSDSWRNPWRRLRIFWAGSNPLRFNSLQILSTDKVMEFDPHSRQFLYLDFAELHHAVGASGQPDGSSAQPDGSSAPSIVRTSIIDNDLIIDENFEVCHLCLWLCYDSLHPETPTPTHSARP